MTDSAAIAKLIYRAHVKPEPPLIDLEYDTFANALELYAKTRMRELIEAGKMELVSESDAAPSAAEEAPPESEESEALKMVAVGEAAAQGLHDGIQAGLQAPPTHTQPDPLRAKALRPSPSPEKDRARKGRSSSI